MDMSEQLTAEHFLPHVDRIFRVKDGRHGLVLKKVELGPPEPDPAVRRSFTLIFTGPPGDVLPEGLYGFDVDAGPTLGFYIIPIHTPARGRQDYQAVFN
jgi:hypothetical protein